MMNRSTTKYLYTLVGLLVVVMSSSVLADNQIQYFGKVIKVADGDTITILIDHSQIRDRLAEIDTPERCQPYWRVYRKALEDLVAGQMVTVVQVDIDRYKRVVGQIYIDGIWVNESLVRSVHAWVYPRYATSKALYEAQKHAQLEKLGLWKLPENERLPPWVWRRNSNL